ncbi:MAG: GFA family protein [Kangiellaceae bacterium]|nr:GFA family protein [Kangiellaceae bacterium]MCW8999666.1 GFA family protein [Kangiellaceae bacterium]MCW9018239.1 GFA family protein [Kangiellaceae bacterium]
MKLNSPIKGSCLCGGVEFEVSQIEPSIGHCHCGMCRKFHGAAFSTFAEAKPQHFKWLKGESELKTYIAKNNTKRKFCRVCGSSIIFESAKCNNIEFALALLDSDFDFNPDAHIYTESAVSWFRINDELPKYLKGRDS